MVQHSIHVTFEVGVILRSVHVIFCGVKTAWQNIQINEQRSEQKKIIKHLSLSILNSGCVLVHRACLHVLHPLGMHGLTLGCSKLNMPSPRLDVVLLSHGSFVQCLCPTSMEVLLSQWRRSLMQGLTALSSWVQAHTRSSRIGYTVRWWEMCPTMFRNRWLLYTLKARIRITAVATVPHFTINLISTM